MVKVNLPFVARGIYDLHIIELKHVPFLETLPEGEMIELQVRFRWGKLDGFYHILPPRNDHINPPEILSILSR